MRKKEKPEKLQNHEKPEKPEKKKMGKGRKALLIIASVMLAAGLGLVLFPPISNFIGARIAEKQIKAFEDRLERVITEDDDLGTGITSLTYADALEAGEIDKQGYPIDSKGKRKGKQVLFSADLERLKRDVIAYNEELKTYQGAKFMGKLDFGNPALRLRDYGITDGVYGYVSAPSINMKLPIYLGASDANMSYGAAHMTYTSLPFGGVDTNAVVAGHTGYIGRIFFDNIRRLGTGDKIYVRTFWGTLTYEVKDSQIHDPSEAECAFIQKGKDMFTMFTCTPKGGGQFNRYFVMCERVTE